MALAPVDVYASSSWVKASRPLAAMSIGDAPAMRSGSTTTSVAMSRSSRNDRLKPCSPRSVTTALRVTSLPVPAVVGTATNGMAGPT